MPAQAQEGGNFIPCGFDKNKDGIVDTSEACGFCSIFDLVHGIVEYAFIWIIPTAATLLLAFGGFLMLTSGGDPGRQNQGKTIITAVITGLIVAYSAWLVVNFIFTFFGVVSWTGTGTWFEFQCSN